MDKDISNQKKLVSIIVPAYNVAQYIRQSLSSILLQTYRELEIIIVNDGSTDNTGEILTEYEKKDPRIIVITQQNKGLAAARNTGLKQAKGEYLCIFDSDDIMLPDKISQQHEFLELHSEHGVCYSGSYHFMDDNKNIYHHPVGVLSGSQYESLLHGNIINPNTVFFRHSVFEKYGGFDETLRSAEDWDYWLTLTYNGVRFGYQPLKLTLYRVRNNSLSANSIMMSQTPISVLDKQLNRSLVNDKQKEIIKSTIDYWRMRLYISYVMNNEITEAKITGNKIIKYTFLVKVIALTPSWVLKLYYLIIKKLWFSSRYKKVKDLNLINYLRSIEENSF